MRTKQTASTCAARRRPRLKALRNRIEVRSGNRYYFYSIPLPRGFYLRKDKEVKRFLKGAKLPNTKFLKIESAFDHDILWLETWGTKENPFHEDACKPLKLRKKTFLNRLINWAVTKRYIAQAVETMVKQAMKGGGFIEVEWNAPGVVAYDRMGNRWDSARTRYGQEGDALRDIALACRFTRAFEMRIEAAQE